jgi:hypothetical protein
MSSSLNLSGWAGDIIQYLDLSGTTTGSVASWLRTNVGSLNLVIRSEYETSGDNAIVPEMSGNVVYLYSKMYECNYLSQESRRASLLGYNDWIEIQGEDQGSIRKVSKSEISKNLLALSKLCKEELAVIIKEYNNSNGGNLPYQILGIPRRTYCCDHE